MLSLLTPYVAYFSGERLHVSGILAVVIAGIYYGWRVPRVLSGRMRLQAIPVWQMVTFILNGILFMLIGLQLPQVFAALTGGDSTLVRHFHPLNWSNARTSRRLVRHLVDDLGN
jgi:CPA1 family monovalent cation:H+ antiporter